MGTKRERKEKDGRKFYISDLHLFHGRLLDPTDAMLKGTMKVRNQFGDLDEMHELIRKNWNNTVSEIDMVYVLGDLGLYNADKIARFMNGLNGRKILIMGNHDGKNIKNERLRACFEDVRYYDIIKDVNKDGDNVHVVLYHYPIEQWEGFYRGYYHIHGHTHGDSTLSKIGKRYEACVEVTNYTPRTLVELEKGEIK